MSKLTYEGESKSSANHSVGGELKASFRAPMVKFPQVTTGFEPTTLQSQISDPQPPNTVHEETALYPLRRITETFSLIGKIKWTHPSGRQGCHSPFACIRHCRQDFVISSEVSGTQTEACSSNLRRCDPSLLLSPRANKLCHCKGAYYTTQKKKIKEKQIARFELSPNKRCKFPSLPTALLMIGLSWQNIPSLLLWSHLTNRRVSPTTCGTVVK